MIVGSPTAIDRDAYIVVDERCFIFLESTDDTFEHCCDDPSLALPPPD